jgi:hypothetical protein
MYTALATVHNIVRYIVLVVLIASFLNAFWKSISKKPFVKTDGIINRIALSFLHVQALLGLILYFISPKVSFAAGLMKNPVARYYTVEHITLMLAAVILVTIGIARVKRVADTKKHASVWVFELIALALISVGLLTLK